MRERRFAGLAGPPLESLVDWIPRDWRSFAYAGNSEAPQPIAVWIGRGAGRVPCDGEGSMPLGAGRIGHNAVTDDSG